MKEKRNTAGGPILCQPMRSSLALYTPTAATGYRCCDAWRFFNSEETCGLGSSRLLQRQKDCGGIPVQSSYTAVTSMPTKSYT